MKDFEHCESLYWVFTHRCNDVCDHCYNTSGPGGGTLTLDECLAIIGNLPERIDRLILSGGEPLSEREKLHAILEAVAARPSPPRQVMLQTNGDLLTGERLDELLARGVSRIDVASMDRYHKHQGQRRAELEDLFRSRGMTGDAQDPLITKEGYLKPGGASYGFWGVDGGFWIGGTWARGRALQTGVWLRQGEHNFCAVLSGGKGFLGGTDLPQEISIQLWKINPCCPGTRDPLGDARIERVSDVLRRVAESPVFLKINEGDPYGMGAPLGIDRDRGLARANELGNVCLWCDEFFERHFDVKSLKPR